MDIAHSRELMLSANSIMLCPRHAIFCMILLNQILDWQILNRELLELHYQLKKMAGCCTYWVKNPANLYKGVCRGVSNKVKTCWHTLSLPHSLPVTQVQLDCLAWLLSRKLSRRHSKAAQNDVILVSKMMQTVLHQLFDAGHWRQQLHLIFL